jgi:hypothetical protein
MMDLDAPGAVLLIHAGELVDVRALLDGLGLGFAEVTPAAALVEDYQRAAIVVSGPQYLLDRLDAGDDEGPVRIAILEGEARTLRAMLSRGGVEWMVRRPFHRAALRGLLLHCIYRGPEKRGARRVSVGAAVHFQTGWRKRGALLAEISERDCRLLADRKVPVGTSIKLRLPTELAGRRPLVLPGRVVRSVVACEGGGSREVCVVFESPGATEALRLKQLIARHQQGPAVLAGKAARHADRQRSSDPSPEVHLVHSVIRFDPDDLADADVPGSTQAQAQARDSENGDDAQAVGAERRRDLRHEFRRRVIALGEEATRVLVGRDISRRGMRVDSSQALAVGETFQIAIHVPGHETPLVLDVEVDRDDGERGVLVCFRELSSTASAYLDEMLGGLAGLSEADGGATVVSEIISER